MDWFYKASHPEADREVPAVSLDGVWGGRREAERERKEEKKIETDRKGFLLYTFTYLSLCLF